ncbi:phosphoribosyltransferase family protein [Reichenbachiella agarivorans]|uniref:Phosphoribosyltransferase family protein n=1 Tax=Reichenbachiella agarivorans TaxID=2979464 RepID=A0ABY6CSC6_9BACT|nr:phosphoribosyltransferase family protein [Reichenbachiella agarivorans]UXP33431.1 phosphoribosyltransferase family protein [Reichenbachiella agarivorans]
MTKNPMLDQLSGVVPMEAAYAFLKYTKKGMAQRLVHQLKYGGSKKVGVILGRWFAKDIQQKVLEQGFDCIMPVPIHRSRLMKRGYNQSLEIAIGMSEVLGIPVETNAIKRVHMTQSQAKKMRLDRLTNFHVEYVVWDVSKIDGRKILLIDDVITTGATITSVCSLLTDYGVKSLSVGCLATGK